jgi:hypothetical protein
VNFFQLILKQLRQRSLSTVLTILSVALGVALATTILIFQREGDKLFGQSDFGFDIILGPKGSKMQLVLNNVYQVSEAQGTIPYATYTDLTRRLRRETRWAAPIAMGDNFQGYRLIGTQPKVFETPEFAAARDAVRKQFDTLRSVLEPLRNPAVSLPFPPNSPALPTLFAMSQSLRELAPQAGRFDPEAADALNEAGSLAIAMSDLLAESSDRAAVASAATALEDALGQAVALLGGPFGVRADVNSESALLDAKPLVFAQGKGFEAEKFECVIGAEVAEKLNLKLGDTIKAEHGTEQQIEGDIHDEKWKIVGQLAPTGTAFDRVILIPLTSFYAIPDHEEGLAEQQAKTQEYLGAQAAASAPKDDAPPSVGTIINTKHFFDDGKIPAHTDGYKMEGDRIILSLPKSDWKLSSVLVNSRNAAQNLTWNYMQTPDAMAVNPATEMRTFWSPLSLQCLFLSAFTTPSLHAGGRLRSFERSGRRASGF